MQNYRASHSAAYRSASPLGLVHQDFVLGFIYFFLGGGQGSVEIEIDTYVYKQTDK